MSHRKPDFKETNNKTITKSSIGDVANLRTDAHGSYTLRDIVLDKIKANEQFRKTFDPDSIKELGESIRTQGVITPIEVIDAGDHYEIVHGERRYRACLLIKLPTIPSIIRFDLTKEDVIERQIITNLQREDLNPIEEAQALAQLMEAKNITQIELGDRIGKSENYISYMMGLIKLISKVQDPKLLSKLSKTTLFEFVPYSEKNFVKFAIIKTIEKNLGRNEIQSLLDDLKKDSSWEKNISAEEFHKETLEIMEEFSKKTKRFIKKYSKILTPEQMEELMVSVVPALKKLETRINEFITIPKE
jgi:ParB family chromosome partitioning protein